MLSLIISIVALIVSIALPIFNYWYANRLFGMQEEWRRLVGKGMDQREASRQVEMLWPWWRSR